MVGVVKNAEFEARHHRGTHGRFGPGMSKPKLLKRDERAVAAIGESFRAHPIPTPGHAAEFTRGQRQRIRPETVSAFHEIAGKLRRGGDDDTRVKAIDEAMAPTDRDLVLTRHVSAAAFGLKGGDIHGLPELLAGRKIVDRAYTPAALHQDDLPDGVTLHIAVPAGTRALVAGDNEMWLDRGIELAVGGVYPNGRGGYSVELTALPKGAPGPATKATAAKKTAKKATPAVPHASAPTPPAETPAGAVPVVPAAPRAAKKAAPAKATATKVSPAKKAAIPRTSSTQRRQASQERTARIREAHTLARHAAEVEELVANGADKQVLTERTSGMVPEIRDAVKRMTTPAALGRRIRTIAATHGLTPVGRAGHVDKLDRRTMTVIGDAREPNGDSVIVVRPGYAFDPGDGEVTLEKAHVVAYDETQFRVNRQGRAIPVVRPAPAAKKATKATAPAVPDPAFPSRSAPKLGDLMQRQASDEVRNHVLKAIGGTFGGLEARVYSVHHVDGAMTIQGTVHDSTGAQVGSFVRDFERQKRKLVASHAYLQLDRTVQGSGFARGFNANLFDWYRRSGFDRVEVHANIDVGGYTWATQGFDFENDEALNGWLSHARREMDLHLGRRKRQTYGGVLPDNGPERLKDAFQGVPQLEIDRQLKEMDDLLAAIATGRQTSAYEISQLGRKSGQGRHDMWIGKFLMLGSHWSGALRL